MTKNISLYLSFLAVLLLLIVFVIYIFKNTSKDLSETQTCSRERNNFIECKSGYECYESWSGGINPSNIPVTPKKVGGDGLCHKICKTDSDCPVETPFCILVNRITDDYIESLSLCFADK